MKTNLKEAVLDLLEKQEDITLTTGENEYYVEDEMYSVTFEYTLEKCDGYYDSEAILLHGYSFKILSIFVINNIDNSEYELCPDDDLQYSMFVDADIEDWSDDYDGILDEYLESNY